ncbi:MAG: hypothetical protein GY898_20410 [Proteobacteria bacterium]|nr:hypothetical protein [Pseudomonadota bacterium]
MRSHPLIQRLLGLGLLAVLLAGAPLAPAYADEPDPEPELSEEAMRETLLLLQRRRIALQVHQVLAETAFVAVLTSASLSTVGTVLRFAGVPKADLVPLDVAEFVSSIVAAGTYSPAGIIAWAAPSPTGYITGKGIKAPFDGRAEHILLSILHGLLYGAYYSTGIALLAGVPDQVRQPLAIGHAACGFGAAIVIGIADHTVGTR